jgi:5-methylcytosine-specific restriction enzyme subunit McrC
MLMEVKELDFKESELSEIDVSKTIVLEVFITKYIMYVQDIIQKGLASSYYDIEGNESFLQGSIVFQQNIVQNVAHKERFYVRYQVYGLNRPENRLIKTTLSLLYKISNDSKNKRNIRFLLPFFDNVPVSTNIESDFDKISLDRNMKYYNQAIKWSRVFLSNKSFNVFPGKAISFALLFPMEKLYEKYVYSVLCKYCTGLNLVDQESSFLFKDDTGKDKVQIKPDIIIRKDKNCLAILDTKWKMISKESDVSQADIYQMYAYSSKYQCDNAILVYPYISKTIFHYKDETRHIRNFNYNLEKEDLKPLLDMINEKLSP